MFGKNDDWVDNSYKHATATPQTVQDTSFGSAGGEFAPVETPPPAEHPSFDSREPQMAAPEQSEPSFEAPAQPIAEAPVAPQFSDAPAVAEAPVAPSPQTTNMSFSEMMAMRSQQQPAAAEFETAAPAGDGVATMEDPAAQDFAPATPEAQPEPAAPETAQAALDELSALAQAEPEAPAYEPEAPAAEAAPAEEAPLEELAAVAQAEAMPAEQLAALQQASQALSDEELAQTGGKTRLQATALKVLVDKAQGQDGNALAQLSTHGFELLEKLTEGMRPGSPALNAVVESAGALISADLVVPADSRAQQTEALQAIAHGVGLQGEVAAVQHNQEVEAQSFAQREAEKKAARQEGLPTGQYL